MNIETRKVILFNGEELNANVLRDKAEKFSNLDFNFITQSVLEKMSDNMLYSFIRQQDDTSIVEEFLHNYSLTDEFDDYYSINYEADEPRTELNSEDELTKMIEFVSEEYEQDFESYRHEQQDSNYPMWNTCFEFRFEPSEETIQAAIDAGFGVIEGLEDFNTILFVAGCGYSFYGAHWIPLFLNLPYNEGLKEACKKIDYSMM